jgi:DNA modification methylase
MKKNEIAYGNCIDLMEEISTDFVDLTLTDIPYDMVNRADNGLRNLNKGNADIKTFDLNIFLEKVYRITKGTIIIFCGVNQVSTIYSFFAEKQSKKLGTTRQLIWQKNNPMPMNGQHIYLSGIENAIWFKKKSGIFNAHCKNTVFKYPIGSSRLHPTEKNHGLLKELILDNSNIGSLVFDPCSGSGSHYLIAKQNNRDFMGCELDENFYKISQERIKSISNTLF